MPQTACSSCSSTRGTISILGNSSARRRSWRRRFALIWTVAATIRVGELSLIGKANAISPFQTCWSFGTVHPEDTMKITGDVRKYAAERVLPEEEALKRGMEEKAKEFVEKGADVYSKA